MEIIDYLYSGLCPVIDPSYFYEYLKDSQDQTTDVRSAIMCNYLRCKKLLILTDVNGIYTEDPKKNPAASKIYKIRARDLINMGRTSVDKGLAEKLIEFGITAFVIGIDNVLNTSTNLNELILKESTVIIL